MIIASGDSGDRATMQAQSCHHLFRGLSTCLKKVSSGIIHCSYLRFQLLELELELELVLELVLEMVLRLMLGLVLKLVLELAEQLELAEHTGPFAPS